MGEILKQHEDTNPPRPAEISLIRMGWDCTASSPVSGDGAAAENKRFSLISRYCCVSVAVVAHGEEEALCNYRCNHPFPAGYRLAQVTWALRDACGRRRHMKSLCWGVSSLAQMMHLSCAFRQGLYLCMPNDSQGIIYQIGEMNHLYSASELLSADRCQSSSQESEWQPCNGRRAPDRQ